MIKFPDWFRIGWWFLFFVGFFILMITRFDKLVSNQFSPFDVFIFFVWLILALFPIISEISFFGIKVKKEVEELKKTVDLNFVSLRTDISNKINLSSTINYYPSSDVTLKEIQEKLENQIENKKEESEHLLKSVPAINDYLFKLRFIIEKEVRRILTKNVKGYSPIEAYNLRMLVSEMYSHNLISKDDVYTIQELLSICNIGIHNQPLSPVQQDFAKEVGEKMIIKLSKY